LKTLRDGELRTVAESALQIVGVVKQKARFTMCPPTANECTRQLH